MSSPSKARNSFSPIQSLSRNFSPSRNLDTIVEQSVFSSQINDKYIDRFEQRTQRRILIENQKLRTDNQVLNQSRRFLDNIRRNQGNQQQKQAQNARRQMRLMSERYQRQNTTLRLQNENLKQTIIRINLQKNQQLHRMLSIQSPSQSLQLSMRTQFTLSLQKTLNDLTLCQSLLQQKQVQLGHLTSIHKQSSLQYEQNLSELISQNNVLKNKLLQQQINNQREYRQTNVRKELEKSRTQGIVISCKENTLFIQKEILRLADQLLKKNISIQAFNKEVLKYQKKIEEQARRNQNALERLRQDTQQTLNDKQALINKLEKQFKQDLAERKRVQIELSQTISSLQTKIQLVNKKLQHQIQTVQDKQKIIRDLKNSIQRKQMDHAKQISKVMSESRVNRKSLKNLSSSYGSFRDMQQGQGSSIIKSGNILRKQSLLQQGSSPLPTVREQQLLAQSQAFPDPQLDIKQIVFHYQSTLQQFRKNKTTELFLANNKIQSLKSALNQKQQELLDILNRFSPLMEFRLGREEIDQERRNNIIQHSRGDVDLLHVMLTKYDIVALRK